MTECLSHTCTNLAPRLAACCVALVLVGVRASAVLGAEKDSSHKNSQPDDGYGLDKIWKIEINISPEEYAKLEPKSGPRFGFRGPAAPPTEQPVEKPAEPAATTEQADVHRGGSFGIEFPWVHADFTADGRTFADVGLRYKGGGSYAGSRGKLRRNFKVDLDRYHDAERVFGHKTLNLNAGAADPTRNREGLAFAVYRAAGVPTPRTAYAEVRMTIPGKYDQELVGLYTIVEQVDKPFLQRYFKNSKGLLLKPEGGMGRRVSFFDYQGDDWKAYERSSGAKREPSQAEAERLIGFLRLVNKADDETFRREIGSYLDVDEFLRFLACTAFVANMDSIFTVTHNAYLYLNPANNKFVFIPWDLDLSFGGFPMSGSAEQLTKLNLSHPYGGSHKFVDRLMADEAVKARFQEILKELAGTAFSKEVLLANLDIIEKTTKPILAEEQAATEKRNEAKGGGGFPGGGPPGFGGRAMPLRDFVEGRVKSVAAQLAGEDKGYMPENRGFGGPGGPGGFVSKPLLAALDKDKDGKMSKAEWLDGIKQFFADSDPDHHGTLDEKQLAAGIQRIAPRPPGFGPPPGENAERPAPDGFGPGVFIGRMVMERADKDQDNKLTLDEFVNEAGVAFDAIDGAKTGTLDERQIGRLIFPGPPGGGPPGGGPPGFGPRGVGPRGPEAGGIGPPGAELPGAKGPAGGLPDSGLPPRREE